MKLTRKFIFALTLLGVAGAASAVTAGPASAFTDPACGTLIYCDW